MVVYQPLRRSHVPSASRVCAILSAVALLLATMAPAQAREPIWMPELALPAALALMPDTPSLRATGVWYADYALAERVYGISGLHTMTNPRIARYFTAIMALRPGPETGASALVMGRWRQIYGYDLFEISSEIYSPGAGTPTHPIAVDVGRLDLAYIGHVLATSGYTPTAIGRDRFFVQTVVPSQPLPRLAMNAVAMTGGRLITGAWPHDVIAATQRIQHGTGTLGLERTYSALAGALGPVQGAYLAANIPPSPYETSPFAPPAGGHRGPRLHHFEVYASAYQEPQPGRRFMEVALAYARPADALADAPTLRARFSHESLPVYGATWARLADVVSVSVHGGVLLVRLRLRSDAPPTLWQDAVVEGDLSILSP